MSLQNVGLLTPRTMESNAVEMHYVRMYFHVITICFEGFFFQIKIPTSNALIYFDIIKDY